MLQILASQSQFRSPFVYAPCLICFLISLTIPTAVAQDHKVLQLEFGKQIERELGGGNVHSYNIKLNAGQYLNVAVDQRGIDVVVIVYGPSDNKVIEVDSPNGKQGIESVILISEDEGNYKLEVRSLEQNASAGRYEVSIRELRSATTQDKKRLSAEKAFAEGMQFNNQGSAESKREALKKFEEALVLKRELLDRNGEAVLLMHVGNIYGDFGDLRKGRSYFEQALTILRAEGDKKGTVDAMVSLSVFNYYLGAPQAALDLADQSLTLSRSIGYPEGEGNALNSLASLNSVLGNKGKAIDYYNQSLYLTGLWRNQAVQTRHFRGFFAFDVRLSESAE